MFLISHDYHSTVHKIFYNKMCHNLKKDYYDIGKLFKNNINN